MKKMTLSVLAAIASVAGASNALAQDAAAGETSFKKCLACHSIGEGAKNKVGPVLNGLDGRKSGSAADRGECCQVAEMQRQNTSPANRTRTTG